MSHIDVNTIPSRIDRLYLHSIEHRAKVGRFGARVSAFNDELERDFSRQEVLWTLVEWHRLIGSTPPSSLPSIDADVRRAALDRIDAFLSSVETEWELA